MGGKTLRRGGNPQPTNTVEVFTGSRSVYDHDQLFSIILITFKSFIVRSGLSLEKLLNVIQSNGWWWKILIWSFDIWWTFQMGLTKARNWQAKRWPLSGERQRFKTFFSWEKLRFSCWEHFFKISSLNALFRIVASRSSHISSFKFFIFQVRVPRSLLARRGWLEIFLRSSPSWIYMLDIITV